MSIREFIDAGRFYLQVGEFGIAFAEGFLKKR